MGEVWLANDVLLEKRVALKFLPGGLIRDQTGYDLFKQEAKKSTLVTHPHIVRVFDFHRAKDLAAISMEYVDGCTLLSLKDDRPGGVFDPHELQKWLGQLCEALEYAHEKVGLVHRDLKPANLMIDHNGDLKITDFGISGFSRPLTDRGNRHRHVSGTAVYMSPQQLMGAPCQPSDDIYALGATIYELLTGRPPFWEGDLVEQILKVKPPRMADRRQQFGIERYPIASHWEGVIGRCLAKLPTDRPPSAKDIAIRLVNPVAQPAPAPARPFVAAPEAEMTDSPIGGGGIWMFLLGNGRLLALGGLVLLVLVSAYWAGQWVHSTPKQRTGQATAAQHEPTAQPIAAPLPAGAAKTKPVAAIAPEPVPLPGQVLRCNASWAMSCGKGRLLLLDTEAANLCLWNEDQGSDLQRVELESVPSSHAYLPELAKVILGYADGRMTQVKLTGRRLGVEVGFAQAPVPPSALVAAGYHVIAVVNQDSSWAEHHLYDGGSGRPTDVGKMISCASSYIWSSKHKRLYFLTDHVSPRDLHFEEIGPASRFTKRGDSPYHDSAGMDWPVLLVGRGDAVLLGSGRLFNPVSLKLERTLPTRVRFVVEFGDSLYCVVGGENPWGAKEPETTKVVRLNAEYIRTASFEIAGSPVALGVGQDGPYVACVRDGKTRIVRLSPNLEPLHSVVAQKSPDSSVGARGD